MADERFSQAVASVDVLDLCGRIIANPDRAMVSLAGKVAMAHAVERLWEVCLEAELLVRALAMPPTPDLIGETQFTARVHAIQTQADTVARLLAALRGETNTETNKQETEDGSCNS
ncbi:MAG: hypothetical protein M9955_17115 [Rhizobiaceae bacterium]|nr:hypothetical protein [Rhizobiaceae bacterium]